MNAGEIEIRTDNVGLTVKITLTDRPIREKLKGDDIKGKIGKYMSIGNEEWRTTNSIVAGFRLQAENTSAISVSH